jgi:hypothetical protein
LSNLLVDLPTMLGTALGFTGSDADMIGGFLLSIGFLIMVGLAMSMGRKQNPLLVSIVMLGVLGVVTVIGWLDYWVLLVAILLVVWMASSTIAKGLPGG